MANGRLQIKCEISEQVVGAMNAVMPLLPQDVRKRFNKLKLFYLQRYGVKALFERVNNRTVAEILAAFDDDNGLTRIRSGEIDGVRYELFDSTGSRPNPPAKD